MKVLAQAKFGDPDSMKDVNSIIQNVPADYHCIVLGATTLEGWQSKVPETNGSMTLMDSKNSVQMSQGFR